MIRPQNRPQLDLVPSPNATYTPLSVRAFPVDGLLDTIRRRTDRPSDRLSDRPSDRP